MRDGVSTTLVLSDEPTPDELSLRASLVGKHADHIRVKVRASALDVNLLERLAVMCTRLNDPRVGVVTVEIRS